MRCETCQGQRWLIESSSDHPGEVRARPCPACNGLAEQSCCEGMCGGPDEVTNTAPAIPDRVLP